MLFLACLIQNASLFGYSRIGTSFCRILYPIDVTYAQPTIENR
jgi:hypothetical protein